MQASARSWLGAREPRGADGLDAEAVVVVEVDDLGREALDKFPEETSESAIADREM